MLSKLLVVLITDLTIRVVRVRDWFIYLRIMVSFTIAVVLDVSLTRFFIFNFALLLNPFKFIIKKFLLCFTDDRAETIWCF